MSNLIVGLTGTFDSGCTTIALSLEKMGYMRISLSEFLKKKGGPLFPEESKSPLQDKGNQLRYKDIQDGNNGGILMRMAFDKAGAKLNTDPIVIECIKNPGEIWELKKQPNSIVVAVNTSYPVRLERHTKDTKGKFELATFELEAERDKHENLSFQNPKDGKYYYYGQEVQRCVDLADVVISNNEQYEEKDRRQLELRDKILDYLKTVIVQANRAPRDVELMMNNACCISLMSKCIKRQVGAIIAFDGKYVIATGYNSVPRGQKDCYIEYSHKCYRDLEFEKLYTSMAYCPTCGSPLAGETTNKYCSNKGNCPNENSSMLRMNISLGKGLDICRALHAEENAIVQTAKLGSGVSLEGSTIYTTTFPCLLCSKKIIEVGIRKVVYIEPYPMKQAQDMLIKAGVECVQFEGVKAQSFFKLFKKYDI
jgi:dCMP deaminase